jgi:hypothetical protein
MVAPYRRPATLRLRAHNIRDFARAERHFPGLRVLGPGALISENLLDSFGINRHRNLARFLISAAHWANWLDSRAQKTWRAGWSASKSAPSPSRNFARMLPTGSGWHRGAFRARASRMIAAEVSQLCRAPR